MAMKKKYTVPAFEVTSFHVDDIITDSITNVFQNGIYDDELSGINFNDGNTLEAIDYTKFFK